MLCRSLCHYFKSSCWCIFLSHQTVSCPRIETEPCSSLGNRFFSSVCILGGCHILSGRDILSKLLEYRCWASFHSSLSSPLSTSLWVLGEGSQTGSPSRVSLQLFLVFLLMLPFITLAKKSYASQSPLFFFLMSSLKGRAGRIWLPLNTESK